MSTLVVKNKNNEIEYFMFSEERLAWSALNVLRCDARNFQFKVYGKDVHYGHVDRNGEITYAN